MMVQIPSRVRRASICSSMSSVVHLNPVRAKMVRRPEEFHYSSNRAYLGLDQPWVIDVAPVLPHFSATKKLAR